MKLAVYIRKDKIRSNGAFVKMVAGLKQAGFELYDVEETLQEGTDMLLSVGGDGTFLSAARLVGGYDVPVLGVNLGRLGFLSENRPDEIIQPLIDGKYTIEDREMLSAEVCGKKETALNEIAVHRMGPAMIGVDVILNGQTLPTYWADGLLVSTSSGSTAYSLSAGGPICTPSSKVLIITPISPHNLNVRPLIIPSDSKLELSFRSRDKELMLTMDNRNAVISRDARISVSVAHFSLKRVMLDKTNFIKALQSKLFWGEDVRNEVI